MTKTIEEILKEFDINFCHIAMTRRRIEENVLDFNDSEPIKDFIKKVITRDRVERDEEVRKEIEKATIQMWNLDENEIEIAVRGIKATKAHILKFLSNRDNK